MHPEHTVWHSSSSVSNNWMQLVFICAERDLGRGTPNSSIRHLDVKVVLVSAACLSLAPHTWFTRLLCKVHLLLRLPLMPLTSDRSLYRAEQSRARASHCGGNTELPLSLTPRDSFQSRPDDATPGEELHKFSTWRPERRREQKERFGQVDSSQPRRGNVYQDHRGCLFQRALPKKAL